MNQFPTHQSLEAEQAILGAILLEPKEAMDEAAGKLKGNEFYPPSHRKIYKTMNELYEEGQPIDLVTVTSRLQDKGWLVEVGDVSYLAQLARYVPTAANVAYYIAIVLEKHLHRQLISDLDELRNEAQNSSNPGTIIDSAQARMQLLTDQNAPKKAYRPLRDILMDCFEDLENKYVHQNGESVTGVTSGFTDLDRMTAGWQKSDFILVGARPSVGKTALALNLARNAAESRIIDQSTILLGETVAIFSLEMSERQLVNRMISAEGNIDAGRIRTGSFVGEDWEKATMAMGSLSELPILIDDTPAISVAEIRAKSRKIKKEKGLGLILIDYLQLITGRSRPGVNRQEEVSEISRTLKQIARELDVPVIALSQLSRGVEGRQDKRPMMSDLRDSGSLEQDADIITFLYRDDYYDKESEKKNIIEVIIAKQRN
ncbi:MAG: replicative helicase, partial [Bacilli bacterium]|nr:replicative helicase [Bacilli bacterium]